MKLSTATSLAILASCAVVSAAPVEMNNFSSQQTMVKREDISEVLNILQELESHVAKRELIENEDDLHELYKREASLIGSLISSLVNSGIIKDVLSKLLNDPKVAAIVKGLVQAAIQTATVQGVALIKAIFNSGLIGDIFNKIMNDASIKGALIDVVKALFTNSVNVLKAAFTSAPAGSSKREDVSDIVSSEFMDKRDLTDTISLIVAAIKNSGVITTLFNKVMENPEQSIQFLTVVFQKGIVVAQDVYEWSKQSGVLQEGLTWLQENGGTYGAIIAKLAAGALLDGSVSASDIDNAASASKTTTAATKTSAAPAAASATGSPSSGGASDALASLAAKYGSKKKRSLY